MAVLRQQNWLGNQRVDIPHLRAHESAVAADIDLLAGIMIAGRSPLIISGFYVLSTGVSIATSLKIRVKDSSLIHFNASESGSIFHVPADRLDEQLNSVNPRLNGSFTPGVANYIGLDFIRQADDTTVDLVEFIDSDSELETPVQVPLGRTLDYRIVISTLDFENNPGVAPIAKVLLDNDGNIVALTDARQFAFRLGSGGTVPDVKNSYSWPSGRAENLTGDTFVGGDKAIGDFKSWMDSVMSRLWEVGGGEYWYSPTNYGNERLTRTGSPFTSNGEYFEWDGTHLHWKGLIWLFANSTSVHNIVINQTTDQVGLTDLLNGECIYVDVDRTTDGTNVAAVKAELDVLGSPTIPGSRYVIAWRYNDQIYTRDQSYAVNSSFILATTVAAGTVRISATPSSSFLPAYAATVDDVGYFAYAGGLSRGSGDFVGGFGDIVIGGGTNDANNYLLTFDPATGTFVEAQNDWASFGVAAFEAHQYTPYDLTADSRIATFKAFNTGSSILEDRFSFEGNGAMGMAEIPGLGGSPPPIAFSSSSPILAKTFLRLNAAGDRDQYCMQDWDNNVIVLAESEPF
jgi:hypothetical protein